MNQSIQHLSTASCKVVEDQANFKVVIASANIFDGAIFKVSDSGLFVKQTQVTPRRMKHGTTFTASVECAAKQIGANKLSYPQASSPEGATCGKEFFSAIGLQALADETPEKTI